MSAKPKKRHMPRAGRGAVIMLVVLLFGSTALRLATGMGAAFASGSPLSAAKAEEQKNEIESSNRIRSDGKHAIESTEPEMPVQPRMNRAEMADLLAALKSRELQMEEREREIERRAKALQVASQEIEKRLLILTDAESELRSTLALADSAAEDDLSRLTNVYENMKPKDASALFEKMDPGFAAGFLGRMRPDAAAAVMAGLSPEKAYSVSVILAGRNASVPKT